MQDLERTLLFEKLSQEACTHTKQISHSMASLLLHFDIHLLSQCLQISPDIVKAFDGELSCLRHCLGSVEDRLIIHT